MLYEEVIEVNERYVLQQEKCQINKKCPVVMGTTGEKVCMARIFYDSFIYRFTVGNNTLACWTSKVLCILCMSDIQGTQSYF